MKNLTADTEPSELINRAIFIKADKLKKILFEKNWKILH